MATQILAATDTTTGTVFESEVPFMVYFETFTDGWFIEFAHKATPDASKHWVRFHERPFESSAGCEFRIFPGVKGLVFRMAGGTTGAVAYRSNVLLSVFR